MIYKYIGSNSVMLLKHLPEDFLVKEKAHLIIAQEGPYAYWLLRKRNRTTHDAIHEIAKWLHVREKAVGFAGMKDKVAVTEQHISIKCKKEALDGFIHHSFTIDFLGYGHSPISLGDLEGNFFVITVRNMEKGISVSETYSFLNLFGEQRFSQKNATIGQLLTHKKYKEAVLEMAQLPGKYENRVKKYIREKPNDYVGALKTIPSKILLLYIHAYQALLWNEYSPSLGEEDIPLLGFGTTFSDEEEKIITPIMKREGITFRDFIHHSFPEITSEGGTRTKWCTATHLISKTEDDEYFPGKKKIILSFFLPKGCYATTFCKALFV